MVMQLLLFQAKDAVKELNTAYRKQIELVREENSLKLQVNNYTSKTVQSKYTFFFTISSLKLFYFMYRLVKNRKFEVPLKNGSLKFR